MNRATLQDREEWFTARLAERGQFEYIGGYVNMKHDVILRHKKCGKIVTQKAYTVIYNSIDKCYECDRHRRGYVSIKTNINHKDTLGIVAREKFGSRYRYKCKCRVCGEEYYFNKKQLEDGIECCTGTSSRMDRLVESRVNDIVRKVKNIPVGVGEDELYDMIKNSYNGIALIRTCVVDIEKFFTKIKTEVEAVLEKKEIKVCPCCQKLIKNKSYWRIDFGNNKRKICKDCKVKK